MERTKLRPGQEVVAVDDVWDNGVGGPDTWLSAAKGQKGVVLHLDFDDSVPNILFETGYVTIVSDSEVEATGKDFKDPFWANHSSERIRGHIGFYLKTHWN